MAEVQIETYEIEDAQRPDGGFDTEEYQAKCEELGLDGQQELLKNEGAIPFQRLDEAARHTWEAFCPGKVKVEQYNSGVIPMRVLGLISVCKEREYFGSIEIWTESEQSPDPILVGLVNHPEYDWMDRGAYLIARWGESLLPWPEVVEKARQKLIRKVRADMEGKIANAKAKMESVAGIVEEYLRGGRLNTSI